MQHSLGNFIGGCWQQASGREFRSTNPATGEILWEGRTSTSHDVHAAIFAARSAIPDWSTCSLQTRIAVLEAFTRQLEEHQDRLALTICREVGKPLWEARTEVQTMIAKVPISVEALNQRRCETSFETSAGRAVTRYKPHGVLTVFGPFNFPGHISHGHIIPALLAGNTVVFKPSELTPAVAELIAHLWQLAGLPDGVLNLVQGDRDTGIALVEHPGHNGVLFTGSLKAGLSISEALVHRPEAMLALELGGNNPLVVGEISHLDAAVYTTLLSAYLTSGQRCTCARRLIILDGNDAYLDRLIQAIHQLVVGPPEGIPEPFMGCLIHSSAVDNVLNEQQRLIQTGAKVLVEAKRLSSGEAFVSPGFLDVTHATGKTDEEVFGPLLQLIRVPDLDAAIQAANDTKYGLAAGLLCDDAASFEKFFREVNAGVINWNSPTTGASGQLPFGGVGKSGNHRPAGFFMIDSCNVPVASLERGQPVLPTTHLPGIKLS